MITDTESKEVDIFHVLRDKIDPFHAAPSQVVFPRFVHGLAALETLIINNTVSHMLEW